MQELADEVMCCFPRYPVYWYLYIPIIYFYRTIYIYIDRCCIKICNMPKRLTTQKKTTREYCKYSISWLICMEIFLPKVSTSKQVPDLWAMDSM